MLEEVIPDLASGPLRARARLKLASIRADEPMVTVELLEAALGDAGADDGWRVEIESDLAVAALLVGRLATSRAHAASALTAAQRLGNPDLLAKALGQLLMTSVCTGEPLQPHLFTQLSAMSDGTTLSAYFQPTTGLGMALYFAGDGEAARPLLERAVQRALSRGEEWDRLGVLLTLVELEWETGNQRLAEQHRHSAEEALGEYAEHFVSLVCADAMFALERGELMIAKAKAERGLELADRAGAVWQAARLTPILADVELLSGQPELAHARLEELRAWLLSSGFGPAGARKSIVWAQDVESLIAMGRLEDAEEVLAELRSRAEVSASPHAQALASRCDGMLLAARGDLAAAIEAMDMALALRARCPWPFEQGRTLLEKGSIERRAKRKAAAKHTLEQALAILEPLEAKIWVSRTRDEVSRIGLRRARAAEGLTPAEQRVAELVASGLTNPEVARQLHMSLRTVESHLSRVYREHGVRSRSQLVAAMSNPASPSRVTVGV
jgi:DNA-binding NarL/FixJ family response regulator